MKRIITTILSVVLATTMSAQGVKSVTEVFKDLAQGKNITQEQSNYGNGYVTYTSRFHYCMTEPCSKEECNNANIAISTTDIPLTADASQKERECIKLMSSSLDSLVKISDDSYHFETHTRDKDTVSYSICIKNAKEEVRKSPVSVSDSHGTRKLLYYNYPDAEEMLIFVWFANLKGCNKHKWTQGDLIHTRHKFIPKEPTAFDQKTYVESILPVLKQKGIKSWDFNWTLDDRYDNDQKKYHEEFYGRVFYYGVNGKRSYAGKATGTIYFIPKEEEKMAVNVFNAIDSLTLIHINKYPQQKHSYEYNIVERVMSRPASTDPTDLIYGYGYNNSKFSLNLTKTEDGYYVAIINSENSYGIPKEWYKLKSYVNGKKEYIVYQTNNQGETEPLLFPSIPK
jgi:hypothetical protein